MKTYWSIFGLPFILTFVFAVDADARSQKRCSKKKAYHYWASVDAVCNKKGKTYEKKGRKSLDEEKKEEKEINDKATALQNSIMNDTAGVNGMVNASEKLTDLQMQANRNMAPRCKKAMDEFKKQCPGQFKGSLKKAQDNLDKYQEMADATKKYTNDDVTQTKKDTADPGMTDEESKAAKSDDPFEREDVKAALERYEARKAAREAAANEMSPWEEQMAQEEAHRNALKERAELQRGANPDPEAVAERQAQEGPPLPEQNPKREALQNTPLPEADPNRAAKQAQLAQIEKEGLKPGYKKVATVKNESASWYGDPRHIPSEEGMGGRKDAFTGKHLTAKSGATGSPYKIAGNGLKKTYGCYSRSSCYVRVTNRNTGITKTADFIDHKPNFTSGVKGNSGGQRQPWDLYRHAGNGYGGTGDLYQDLGCSMRQGSCNNLTIEVFRKKSYQEMLVEDDSAEHDLIGTVMAVSDSVPAPISKTAFNNEDALEATEHAEMALANLDICGASQQIRDIATSDSEVSLNSAAGMSSQLDEMLIEKGYPPGSLGIEMYCQNQ